MTALFCFPRPENTRFVQSGKKQKNSVDAFALAGMVFCRSNREKQNPSMACDAYRQSAENLKSYMQRQWNLKCEK